MLSILATFLFLKPVVPLLLFLIFSPVQFMKTNVVSTGVAAGELMGLNNTAYEKKEEPRVFPGVFLAPPL